MKRCYVCSEACSSQFTIQIQQDEVTDVMPICDECFEAHHAQEEELEPPPKSWR